MCLVAFSIMLQGLPHPVSMAPPYLVLVLCYRVFLVLSAWLHHTLCHSWWCLRYPNCSVPFPAIFSKPHLKYCIDVGTRGLGAGPPPIFYPWETLLIFIHTVQIAALQCILRSALPKMELLPCLCIVCQLATHLYETYMQMTFFPSYS